MKTKVLVAAAVLATGMQLGSGSAQAAPAGPNLAPKVGDATEVRWHGGWRGRGWDRGRHYGWYRGRHRGWYGRRRRW